MTIHSAVVHMMVNKVEEVSEASNCTAESELDYTNMSSICANASPTSDKDVDATVDRWYTSESEEMNYPVRPSTGKVKWMILDFPGVTVDSMKVTVPKEDPMDVHSTCVWTPPLT